MTRARMPKLAFPAALPARRDFCSSSLQIEAGHVPATDDDSGLDGTALRLTSLAAGGGGALSSPLVPVAAAFVFVLDKYGPVEACLAVRPSSFVVTLIAAAATCAQEPDQGGAPSRPRKSARKPCLADPMVVAAGLQIVRMIGVKKADPISRSAGWRWAFAGEPRSFRVRRGAGE